MSSIDNKIFPGEIPVLGDAAPGTAPQPAMAKAADPLHCEGCGAKRVKGVAECAYCGRKIPEEELLESETRALLAALEASLKQTVALRTDLVLTIVLSLCIAAVPVGYIMLDLFTELGLMARLGLTLLVAFFGFCLLGSQAESREGQAERLAWRESIGPELRRYMDRQHLSNTELIALSQRLLAEDSRLRRVILSCLIG